MVNYSTNINKTKNHQASGGKQFLEITKAQKDHSKFEIHYLKFEIRNLISWLTNGRKYYTIIVFCWGQYEFLWTLKTILTEAFRLRWILISNVHKNSYWPIQKTNCFRNIISLSKPLKLVWGKHAYWFCTTINLDTLTTFRSWPYVRYVIKKNNARYFIESRHCRHKNRITSSLVYYGSIINKMLKQYLDL
jgi:hypothetical protein